MSTFSELFQKYVSPYYFYIVVVIVAIIFGLVAKYAYDNHFNEKTKEKSKFSDVANATGDGNNQAIILFFHADWCPHCKSAMPEWVKFKGQYDGKTVNGYTIKCQDVNCTEETSDVTNSINEYQIDSYPTVKMLKDGQKIEFDSKITQYTLEQFVTTMTTN